jgi:hypothetical protein
MPPDFCTSRPARCDPENPERESLGWRRYLAAAAADRRHTDDDDDATRARVAAVAPPLSPKRHRDSNPDQVSLALPTDIGLPEHVAVPRPTCRARDPKVTQGGANRTPPTEMPRSPAHNVSH